MLSQSNILINFNKAIIAIILFTATPSIVYTLLYYGIGEIMGKNKKQGSINKPLETTQKIGKKSKPKNKYTISIEAQQEQ